MRLCFFLFWLEWIRSAIFSARCQNFLGYPSLFKNQLKSNAIIGWTFGQNRFYKMLALVSLDLRMLTPVLKLSTLFKTAPTPYRPVQRNLVPPESVPWTPSAHLANLYSGYAIFAGQIRHQQFHRSFRRTPKFKTCWKTSTGDLKLPGITELKEKPYSKSDWKGFRHATT